MRHWVIVAGGLALLPVAASAQAASQDEIVVTAPLEGSQIESLQGAIVLRREDLLETLNGGLGETLERTPGVSSTFYGAGASRPIIRGLGEDRVRVLQNGVGAIDAASASPDHAVTSDGLEADRIEVLRGAAALAYGGNAIGGVINVLDQSIPTRVPAGGRTLAAFGALTSGNEGREGALAATLGEGPFVLRLDASARETGDYEIPGFTNSDGTGTEGVAPNSFTSLTSYGVGASRVGQRGFAGLAVQRHETEYGLPPENAGEAGGRIELEQTRIETRGELRARLGPFDHFDWGAQRSDYTHTEFEADGAPGTTFSNEGYEARVEAHNRGLADRLRGAIGAQVSDVDFRADGEESFIAPTGTRDWGLFAVQRYDLGWGGLEGGARYEAREVANEALGVREFDAASVSLGGFWRPAENWFVGVTAARTERAPTAVELFAEGPHLATAAYEQGDTSLDVETARSLELSARYGTAAVSFEANVYRVDFDDYIALSPTGLVFYDDEDMGIDGIVGDGDPILGSLGPDAMVLPVFAFGARDARFEGGEVSLEGRLFALGAWTVRADAAVDWVRATFDAGGNVPRIPPRSVTLGLNAESEALTLRVEGVDTAAQNDVAFGETATAGSTVLNARATWRPFGRERAISLMLDGRNLTDEDVRVHSSFLKDVLPRPGRSLRLALAAQF